MSTPYVGITDFSIDRSTVSKIVTDCKKTEQRRRNGEEEKPVPKQSKSGVARYPEVDTAVGLYVDTRVAQGLTTNPEELHALALEVAAKSGYKDFKGSAKWVDNVRHLTCHRMRRADSSFTRGEL